MSDDDETKFGYHASTGPGEEMSADEKARVNATREQLRSEARELIRTLDGSFILVAQQPIDEETSDFWFVNSIAGNAAALTAFFRSAAEGLVRTYATSLEIPVGAAAMDLIGHILTEIVGGEDHNGA